MSQQADSKNNIPANMEVVYFGLLLAGPNADAIESADLEKIQADHMAHIQKLATAGKLVLAGPFLDGGQRRGVFVFRTETLDEAEALAAADPAVKAGRLAVDIHPWMVEKGAIPATAVSPKTHSETK